MKIRIILIFFIVLAMNSCALFSTGGLEIPELNGSGTGLQTFYGFIVDDTLFYVTTQKMIAYGGEPLSSYTWSVANQSSLPAGTAIDPLTGTFHASGGAILEGNHEFDITVSDGNSTATGTFIFKVQSYNVTCPLPVFQQPMGVYDMELPDASTSSNYGACLQAFGDAPLPWSWYIDTGELPSGMVLDEANGIIRGKPMASEAGETFTFSVRVVASDNSVAAKDGLGYSITVK